MHNRARAALSEWLIVHYPDCGEVDSHLWDLMCRLKLFDSFARKVNDLVKHDGNSAAERSQPFLHMAHWLIGARMFELARQPSTGKRGSYSAATRTTLEVRDFLQMERGKAVSNELFGTSYPVAKKHEERRLAFLNATDSRDRRRYMWRPRNWDVFRQVCKKAERYCAAAVRADPEILTSLDSEASLTEEQLPTFEARALQRLVDLSSLYIDTHDFDSLCDGLVLAAMAAQGWPSFSFGSGFVIGPGEECTRELLPGVPEQDKADMFFCLRISAESLERWLLTTTPRERRAARAQLTAQSAP